MFEVSSSFSSHKELKLDYVNVLHDSMLASIAAFQKPSVNLNYVLILCASIEYSSSFVFSSCILLYLGVTLFTSTLLGIHVAS